MPSKVPPLMTFIVAAALLSNEANGQALVPECYAVSRDWLRVRAYDGTAVNVYPDTSLGYTTLLLLLASAQQTRDRDSIVMKVRSLWQGDSLHYEMLLAYLVASGGQALALEGEGLHVAAELYHDLSGRAGPLLHYYGVDLRAERLPRILEAIRQPLSEAEQGVTLRIACDAAWMLLRWHQDTAYKRVAGSTETHFLASHTFRQAYRVSSGQVREALRRQAWEIDPLNGLSLPVDWR